MTISRDLSGVPSCTLPLDRVSSTNGGRLRVSNLTQEKAQLTVNLLGAKLDYETETHEISGVLVVPKRNECPPINFSEGRQRFFIQVNGENRLISIEDDRQARDAENISRDKNPLDSGDIERMKTQLNKEDLCVSNLLPAPLPDQTYEVCRFKQIVDWDISSLSLDLLPDGHVKELKLDDTPFLKHLDCTYDIHPYLSGRTVSFSYPADVKSDMGSYKVALEFAYDGNTFRQECDLPPLRPALLVSTTGTPKDTQSGDSNGIPVIPIVAVAAGTVICLGLLCCTSVGRKVLRSVSSGFGGQQRIGQLGAIRQQAGYDLSGGEQVVVMGVPVSQFVPVSQGVSPASMPNMPKADKTCTSV